MSSEIITKSADGRTVDFAARVYPVVGRGGTVKWTWSNDDWQGLDFTTKADAIANAMRFGKPKTRTIGG